jgi:small subunit ribosomal protein S3
MEHDPMAQDRKAEDSGQARARSTNQRGPASGPQGAGA